MIKQERMPVTSFRFFIDSDNSLKAVSLNENLWMITNPSCMSEQD
jgi:hypothetical protein